MIAKIHNYKANPNGEAKSATGFSSRIKYVEKDGAEEIDNINLFTKNHAVEMAKVAASSTTKRAVLHVSLSLPKGEIATKEQWQIAAREYIKGLGLNPELHQYKVVRHGIESKAGNGNFDHVHLILNKVDMLGKYHNLQDSFKLSMQATKRAEMASGLVSTDYRAQNIGKVNGLKSDLKYALARAGGDFRKFKQELENAGVKVILNQSPTTGRISGISYKTTIDNRVYKASSLGKGNAYSVFALEKGGMQINQQRQKQNAAAPMRMGAPSASAGYNRRALTGQSKLNDNAARGRQIIANAGREQEM